MILRLQAANNDTLTAYSIFQLAYGDINIKYGYATAAVALIQLLILGILIWRELVKGSSAFKSTLKTIFSPANTLIFWITASNCLTVVLYLFQFETEDMLTMNILNIFVNFFYFGYIFLVVYYTWNRGAPVVQAMLPSSSPFLAFLVTLIILSYLTLFATVVVSDVVSDNDLIDKLYYAGFIIGLEVEIVIFIYDFIFLVVYFLYLRRVKEYGMDTEKLSILSWFGVASFVCFQFQLGSIVALNYATPETITFGSLVAWITITHVSNLAPLIFVFVQLLMKLVLQREEARRIDSQAKSLEYARHVSNQPFLGESNSVQRSSGMNQSFA
ncbi:UNVERIFIED_CONTAM: hypothetical protein HDU68_011544 [Siphonaria sp. JEL0065]|nr:hypothetical protein HDU68_011544 [Siphonaria sp. JEL0065]